MQKIAFLFFYFLFFFLSCGSKVQFLKKGEEKEDPPPEQTSSSECVEKVINGKTICVQQEVKIFLVEELAKKPIDFLFVVDVSPSMWDDLSRLGQAFSDLMSQISVSDWQMLFTTADHGDYEKDPKTGQEMMIFSPQQDWKNYKGKAPHFGQFMDLEYKGKRLNQKSLTATTPDYINVFKDTLTKTLSEDCSSAPYCQGSLEQPLRVLKSSLERLKLQRADSGSSSPSLRDSASFVSFIVTDEDERVEDPDKATSAKEVVESFKKWFPEKSFHSFALLIQDEECLNLQKAHSPNSVYGEKVSKLAELTQGKNVSLCETNYGPPLREISHLLRNLIESLDLDYEPVLPEEIQVEFIKGKSQADWTLEGKKLTFKAGLEPEAEIKVSYFVEKNK